MKIKTLICPTGHPSRINYLIFTPDGKRLISACDLITKCWDLESGNLIWTLDNGLWIMDMDVTPDSKLLLRANEALEFIDIEKGKVIDFLKEDCDFVEGVKVSPKGSHFAILTRKDIKESESLYHIQIRDLETRQVLWQQQVNDKGPLGFTSDGQEMLYGKDKAIQVFDIMTGKRVKVLEINEDLEAYLFSLKVSPDDKFILCGFNRLLKKSFFSQTIS